MTRLFFSLLFNCTLFFYNKHIFNFINGFQREKNILFLKDEKEKEKRQLKDDKTMQIMKKIYSHFTGIVCIKLEQIVVDYFYESNQFKIFFLWNIFIWKEQLMSTTSKVLSLIFVKIFTFCAVFKLVNNNLRVRTGSWEHLYI